MIKNSKGLVYVQGKAYNGITARVFQDNGYDITQDIDESDIVVWTGGEDINPNLYGEKPLAGTCFSVARDREDLEALKMVENKDKFLVGICRGAQLLNCTINQGSLWQDVDNHGGCRHPVTDKITGEKYIINSVHHQAMKLTPKAELIAYTDISSVKESYGELWYKDNFGQDTILDEGYMDIEAAYYEDTKSLLFQAHPEFSCPETSAYFFNLMDRYYHAA